MSFYFRTIFTSIKNLYFTWKYICSAPKDRETRLQFFEIFLFEILHVCNSEISEIICLSWYVWYLHLISLGQMQLKIETCKYLNTLSFKWVLQRESEVKKIWFCTCPFRSYTPNFFVKYKIIVIDGRSLKSIFITSIL